MKAHQSQLLHNLRAEIHVDVCSIFYCEDLHQVLVQSTAGHCRPVLVLLASMPLEVLLMSSTVITV